MTDKRTVDVLALLFIALWIVLAIQPLFRRDIAGHVLRRAPGLLQ